jgi:hypothetical protein
MQEMKDQVEQQLVASTLILSYLIKPTIAVTLPLFLFAYVTVNKAMAVACFVIFCIFVLGYWIHTHVVEECINFLTEEYQKQRQQQSKNMWKKQIASQYQPIRFIYDCG